VINEPREYQVYTIRPAEPMLGIVTTCLLCFPYLSDSLKFFPRSTAHDVVLGVVLAVVWGTIFYWDDLGTKLPRVRWAIEKALEISVILATLAIYAVAIYFIVTD
jgi:hypothetical protein